MFCVYCGAGVQLPPPITLRQEEAENYVKDHSLSDVRVFEQAHQTASLMFEITTPPNLVKWSQGRTVGSQQLLVLSFSCGHKIPYKNRSIQRSHPVWNNHVWCKTEPRRWNNYDRAHTLAFMVLTRWSDDLPCVESSKSKNQIQMTGNRDEEVQIKTPNPSRPNNRFPYLSILKDLIILNYFEAIKINSKNLKYEIIKRRERYLLWYL